MLIVGGGISALQLLDEVSKVTTTTLGDAHRTALAKRAVRPGGRAHRVRLVEQRVRAGLPPNSVVSVTGLPLTPAVEAMRARGVLERQPMFAEITVDGVRWADGRSLKVDVILWCTASGVRSTIWRRYCCAGRAVASR